MANYHLLIARCLGCQRPSPARPGAAVASSWKLPPGSNFTIFFAPCHARKSSSSKLHASGVSSLPAAAIGSLGEVCADDLKDPVAQRRYDR
jgi:hypothetical protein